MVDVGLEVTTDDPCPADRRWAIGENLVRWATGNIFTSSSPTDQDLFTYLVWRQSGGHGGSLVVTSNLTSTTTTMKTFFFEKSEFPRVKNLMTHSSSCGSSDIADPFVRAAVPFWG